MPEVYVRLKAGFRAQQGDGAKVVAAMETKIGKIARPKNVYIVPDMPKTRSGKLMRRVLASISNQRDTGDISTLANPDIVLQIQEMARRGR